MIGCIVYLAEDNTQKKREQFHNFTARFVWVQNDGLHSLCS